MSTMDEQIQAGIAEQAAEWYTRHREGSLTDGESAEFIAWLQTSPRHVHEYLAAAQVAICLSRPAMPSEPRADLIARARQWIEAQKQSNVVALRPASGPFMASPGRARWAAVFALFAVGLAAVAGWAILSKPGLNGWERVLEVPRGEQRTVHLRDGSVLHLNAETRLRVRYSAARRLIELDYGQAMFDVARDPSHPFVVRAGATEVAAVGTQFDVSRREPRGPVIVTVVEGKVDVIERDAQLPTLEARSLRLAAGQRVRVARLDEALPEPDQVDARVATAWLRRELIFSEERLGAVAEEFSRYGVPIEIDDPQLRDYRVSGVFSAYDTESFVAFLRRFGKVEQTEKGIRMRAGGS